MAKPSGPRLQNPPAEPNPFQIEAYKQVCEDFRQLNQSFWQAPVIIVSITGGIGLAVATVESWYLRVGLLILAAFCNAAWAWVIVRLRSGVMEQLLRAKQAFEEKFLPLSTHNGSERRVIMKIFVALLITVSFACLLAAGFVTSLFPEKEKSQQITRSANVQNYMLVSPACAAPAAPVVRPSGEKAIRPVRPKPASIGKPTSCLVAVTPAAPIPAR